MTLEDKKIEIYKNLLLGISGVTEAKYLKTVESSVTTSWGVNWDHDYIARDILQNFRDANLKEIDKIKKVSNLNLELEKNVDILNHILVLQMQPYPL